MDPQDEQRWIVVDGRRWRATDPAIPDKFRVELVAELMSARRAVAAAGTSRKIGTSRTPGTSGESGASGESDTSGTSGESGASGASGASGKSGTSGASGNDVAMASARARVGDAKVALGERGQPWWEAPTDAGRRDRISATIRALSRHRGSERTICPSDVARTIGGESWRSMMPLIRTVAGELATAGQVHIMQNSVVVDPTATWKGPIRIRIADA